MRLEVGKTYPTKGGGSVTIVHDDGTSVIPFRAQNGAWYYPDGRANAGGGGPFDLILTPDLTQITTPFGLLDEETQKALKAHEGGIEVYAGTGWERGLGLYWIPTVTYRAKPEPKRETFTGECRAMVFQRRCPTLTDEGTQGQPGKYTADVVDGKITRIVWEASE